MDSENLGCSLGEFAAKAGYAASKAKLMEMLLLCAVETLKYAEERLDTNWADFCGKKGAIRTSPLKKKKSKIVRPDENAMTYELGEYISYYFKTLADDHPFRGINFCYEKPLPSKKLAGSSQKSLDMRYEVSIVGGPELVIEAKPLYDEVDIAARYLHDEGVGRFTREDEPYSSEDVGAMLGYIESGQRQDWDTRIRAEVVQHGSYQMIVDVELQPWHPVVATTRHARVHSGVPVWILHLLLQHPKAVIPAS